MATPSAPPLAASRISYDKYWNLPVDDLEDEENRTSLMRQQQSTFLSKAVAVGIVFAMMGAVVTAIVFYEQNHVKESSPSSPYPSLYPTGPPIVYQSCYNNMTCPVQPSTDPLYNPDTGFTNYTGWYLGPGDESCCNICPLVNNNQQLLRSSPSLSPAIVARDSERRQALLAGFDYLILDSIWLPSWCQALSEGHDPTLSHPAGSLCSPANSIPNNNRLSIHGLWPSNNRPVPLSCCVGSLPLVPSIVDDPNWSELLLGMEEDWLDVTAEADGDCSTCYLWNHEWQKHGSCYGSSGPAEQRTYFSSGLSLFNALNQSNADLAAVALSAASDQRQVSSGEIQALYPMNVRVMCDPMAATPSFLELHTCWIIAAEDAAGIIVNGYEMVDCSSVFDDYNSDFSSDCGDGLFTMPIFS